MNPAHPPGIAYTNGSPLPVLVRIYPDELFELHHAYAAACGRGFGKSRLTDGALTELATGRRTVRILFDNETGLARADELCGDLIIEPVTDGKWEDLNDVEITARIYAWARELPVSRLDAP